MTLCLLLFLLQTFRQEIFSDRADLDNTEISHSLTVVGPPKGVGYSSFLGEKRLIKGDRLKSVATFAF